MDGYPLALLAHLTVVARAPGVGRGRPAACLGEARPF